MGGAEGKGKKGKAAAGARKKWWPGGPRKKQQKLAAKKLQGKGKAEAPPPAPAAHKGKAPASGDVDDFMDMLDTMEDFKSVDGAGSGSGESDAERDGGDPRQQEEQQDAAAGGGSGSGEGAAGGEPAGGKKAKKRRKRGQKLSAVEFEARRDLVRQIAECPAEEQADWLWGSLQQHTAASALECGGLVAAGMAPLPAERSLEARLKALQPGSWQAEFCGGVSSGKQRQGQRQARQQERPPGSPSLLLVSPSAIGAVGLIKLCPQFHGACRIGKLFAKHMKVQEQEELLRSQVMCIAAGTPNRLCKLADGGALRLDRLKHVVLDVQLDAKQRDILAIPETRADWWLFYDRHLKERLAAGALKISLVNSDHAAGGGS